MASWSVAVTAVVACVVAARGAPCASAFAPSLGRFYGGGGGGESSSSSSILASTGRRIPLDQGAVCRVRRGAEGRPWAWTESESLHRISMSAKEGGDGGSSSSSGSASKVLSFLCPLLKLLANTDPSAPRNKVAEDATIAISVASRWLWGRQVSPIASSLPAEQRPLEPIILYEFEACPFCRRVRETLTCLDLEVQVRPCPKGSAVHRAEVLATGGKETFPFIMDGNTGVKLYESGDIVRYLVESYGGGSPIPPYLLESTLISGWVPTLARAGRGMTRSERAVASPPSPGQVSLFGYEGDGGCRLVREALCELEIPYRLVNVGEGSSSGRRKLQDAGGSELPFLVDSAAGMSIQGAQGIMMHLFDTYMTPKGSS